MGLLCGLREDVCSSRLGLALSTMLGVVLEVGLEELLVLDGVLLGEVVGLRGEERLLDGPGTLSGTRMVSDLDFAGDVLRRAR